MERTNEIPYLAQRHFFLGGRRSSDSRDDYYGENGGPHNDLSGIATVAVLGLLSLFTFTNVLGDNSRPVFPEINTNFTNQNMWLLALAAMGVGALYMRRRK